MELWKSITGKKVNLVPLRSKAPAAYGRKVAELQRHYAVSGPLAFLHVNLIGDRSEFMAHLRVHLRRPGDDYVINVHGAVSVANTIAYISELIDPTRLFLSLTGQNQMTQLRPIIFMMSS